MPNWFGIFQTENYFSYSIFAGKIQGINLSLGKPNSRL